MLLFIRLDFCNSLFYGIPKYFIYRLQNEQNTVAHIVTNSSRFSQITPTLKSLLWLPLFIQLISKYVALCNKLFL